MATLRSICLGLCLTLFLSSCAQDRVLTKVKTITLRPPAYLLAPRPIPALRGPLTRDLVQWAMSLAEALRASEQDRAQLRAWARAHDAGVGGER